MKVDKTRNIDELYDELPGEERTTAIILREMIFETIEVKREKLSWGAPFYYGYSPICYVWPASIPWGGIESGVALGFWRGKNLADPSYLDRGERKQLYRKLFYTPEEIDVERVQSLLLEAQDLDREFQRNKSKSKN